MGLKINRNELNIEHALGAGGEGTVYDLPKDYSIRGLQGPFVYKEYLDFVKQDGKAIAVQIALDYMVNAYERLSRDEKAYIDQRAAWPLATVVDQDGATGLLMRKVIVQMVDPLHQTLIINYFHLTDGSKPKKEYGSLVRNKDSSR